MAASLRLDAVQVAALEFSRERKMMSVLCRQDATSMLFVKGAPEAILDCCSQVASLFREQHRIACQCVPSSILTLLVCWFCSASTRQQDPCTLIGIALGRRISCLSCMVRP